MAADVLTVAVILEGFVGEQVAQVGYGVVPPAAQGEQLRPDQPKQMQSVVRLQPCPLPQEEQRLQMTWLQSGRCADDLPLDGFGREAPAQAKKSDRSSSQTWRSMGSSADVGMASRASFR